MKATIVIAVYNEENYLKKCLLSLAEQTFKNFEIIVVDDGSTDKTWRVLRNLNSQLSNLKMFKQQHQGPARARNFAAKQAKGEILVFLDGDMYFDKNFLEDLLEPIRQKRSKGAFSTEEYVANWDNFWARCWNYNWGLSGRKRIDLRRVDQVKDFRAILKKEFNQVGGFDDIGYTDTWTLSEKLGYRPQSTKGLYYHYNPASLKEVFTQARWAAKRRYKFGFLGKALAFLRATPLISLVVGLKKAIEYQEPFFFFFKFIYDGGAMLGLLESCLTGENYVL